MPAGVDAVHAGHAARVVDPVLHRIDARGLAFSGAERAGVAFPLVDHGAEERVAGQGAEYGAHRADRVAVGTSAAPGQHDEHDERRGGDEQRREALQPHVGLVEGVAVGPLGEVGQQVVAPAVDRGEEVCGDPPVGAVGCQQGDQRADACGDCRHEEHQHGDAQPPFGRRVGEAVAVLPAAAAQPRDDVLENPQRADDRTVDAPQEEREHHQRDDDGDVERQHGRQELDSGEPSEPGVERPRKVEQQQRDERETDDGKGDSDLAKHVRRGLTFVQKYQILGIFERCGFRKFIPILRDSRHAGVPSPAHPGTPSSDESCQNAV